MVWLHVVFIRQPMHVFYGKQSCGAVVGGTASFSFGETATTV